MATGHNKIESENENGLEPIIGTSTVWIFRITCPLNLSYNIHLLRVFTSNIQTKHTRYKDYGKCERN